MAKGGRYLQQDQGKKKKKGWKIFLIVVLILVLIIGGIAAAAVGVFNSMLSKVKRAEVIDKGLSAEEFMDMATMNPDVLRGDVPAASPSEETESAAQSQAGESTGGEETAPAGTTME